MPFVAVNLEPVFGRIGDYVGIVDAAVARARSHRPRSAGGGAQHGRAGVAWLSRCATTDAVEHVVTIGSPHHGTWLARPGTRPTAGRCAAPTTGWRDCRKEKPRSAGAPPYARFTCFYSHCDNIVFPPSTATLLGRTTATCPAARTCTAAQPEVFEAVWSRLAAAQRCRALVLQHAAADLVELDALEQRAEVAFAEAPVALCAG